MRRSWIALIIAVAIIVVAIVVGTHQPAGPPAEGPTAPSTATPSTRVEVAKPATHTPAPATGVGPVAPATATPPKPTTATPPPEPPKAEAVLAKAEAQLDAGQRLDAIKTLSAALLAEPQPDDPAALKQRLTKLADEALFTPRPCPGLSVVHEAVAGDSLWKIARQHKTTVGLLKRINGLPSDAIRIGQRLKVVPGGFDAAVSKSRFTLTLTKGGVWVREFKVGLGKDGSTPIGEFVAGHKLKEPTYFGDGAPVPFEDKKNNPLGTRWITIQGAGAGQYGIHGTWEPESIGKEMSKGCVRMLNAEVEWLFDLIVPGESKIAIKP